MEDGDQEAAQKKKAEKKRRQMRTVERGESGMESRKKWLQASRSRQARLMVSRRPHNDQLGKVSCEAAIAGRLKMKKRREVGEKGTRWQHSGDEEQQLEGIVGRRRMEGSSLELDAMQKVLELVVNERMSQGKRVTSPKGKKKVPGWSIEQIKEKPNIAVEEDTEEMRKWRGLNQSAMDQCWKNFVESMEEEVLVKNKDEKSKKEALRGRGAPLEWRSERTSKKKSQKVWRRLLGGGFLFVQRIHFAADTKEAGRVDGSRRDEAAAKNDNYEGVVREEHACLMFVVTRVV